MIFSVSHSSLESVAFATKNPMSKRDRGGFAPVSIMLEPGLLPPA
jgi:hypothetical protein